MHLNSALSTLLFSPTHESGSDTGNSDWLSFTVFSGGFGAGHVVAFERTGSGWF